MTFAARQFSERPKPLPPTKAACLTAMTRAPLVGVWNGSWTSEATGQEWNSHTPAWLVSKGWAAFNRERTEATITRAGRQFEQFMEVSP